MLENPNGPVHDFSKLGLKAEPAGEGLCDQCGRHSELSFFTITNSATGEESLVDGAFCSVECMLAAWD